MAKILEKSKTGEFLSRLGKDAMVLAPVERGGMVLFAAPAEGEAIALDFANTRNSPKSAFFPQSEPMYSYERKGSVFEMKDTAFDERPRILFAVRPCDAKSFTIIDRLFVNEEFVDPYYKAKRDDSVVFALGCASPCQTCFCTSLECGPFSTEGADVFMTDLGEFPTVNEISREVLGAEPPARATVQVAALPLGARIEIDGIAVLPPA